jgi:hypothetical protein
MLLPRAFDNGSERACRPDIGQFGSDAAPGQGRIQACMKAHLRDFSEPCKEALFQAWLQQ